VSHADTLTQDTVMRDARDTERSGGRTGQAAQSGLESGQQGSPAGQTSERTFRTPLMGMNAMDPPLCGSTVIRHTEGSETDHDIPARRTSPMKQALSLVAIDLAKKSFRLHRITW